MCVWEGGIIIFKITSFVQASLSGRNDLQETLLSLLLGMNNEPSSTAARRGSKQLISNIKVITLSPKPNLQFFRLDFLFGLLLSDGFGLLVAPCRTKPARKGEKCRTYVSK